MYRRALDPTTNREDWIHITPLIEEETGEEITLTDTTMYVYVCEQGCPNSPVLSGSTVDGKITFPTTTSFQWAFDADDMGALCAGTYDVYLRIIIDDVTTQILACTVQVLDGGPSS